MLDIKLGSSRYKALFGNQEQYIITMWKEEAKQTITRFIDETSMQGVPFISRAQTTRVRLLWGLVVLLLFAMVIFMLSLLIIRYFSYPIMVDVRQVSVSLKWERNYSFRAIPFEIMRGTNGNKK